MSLPSSNKTLEVGIGVVVVPNGVERIGNDWYCNLSLALSPDPNSSIGPRVDICCWPSYVASIKRFVVGTGNIVVAPTNREISHSRYINKDDESSGRPDLKLGAFEQKATQLWQRIFDDGSNDPQAGFRALVAALTHTASSSSSARNTRIISSPTQELARAIDGLSSSVMATHIVHRVAIGALKATDLNGPFPPHLTRAALPGSGWWKMIREDWFADSARQQVSRGTPYGGDDVPFESAVMLPTKQFSNADGATKQSLRNLLYAEMGGPDALLESVHFFVDRVGNLPFWYHGEIADHRHHSRSAARAFQDAINRHHEFLEGGYTVRRVDLADPTTKALDESIEAARRKYSGILAYPTLAKYLGLIVDTSIKAPLLLDGKGRTRSYGAVAAYPVMEDGFAADAGELSQLTWTAHVIRVSTDQSTFEYYGPCGRDESIYAATHNDVKREDLSNHVFIDGILNLDATIEVEGQTKSRFALNTLDVTNATVKYEQCAVPETDQAAQIPDLLTRGIGLLDNDRHTDEKKQSDHEHGLSDPGPNQRILDAQDLFLGYQIDVALTTKSKEETWRDTKRWRTLTARSIGYGRDIGVKFLHQPSVQRFRTRDDGYVRPMTKQTTKETAKEDECILYPHSELFCWVGESLAIPHFEHFDGANQKNWRPIEPVAAIDFAVDIEYDLPSNSGAGELYRKAPPLREARGYMFGARVHFLNGCCLPFAQAVKRYVDKHETLALGINSNRPYPYRRRCQVVAPDVLLPWNEKLVTVPDVNLVKGETVTQLVVRDNESDTVVSRRFLTPPRITFDLAEQYGLFDKDHSKKPVGAFSGNVRAQLRKADGSFPVARKGRWSAADPGNGHAAVKGVPPKQEESRGSVFVLDAFAEKPDVFFYPDPMARQVGFNFVRNGRPVLGFRPLPAPVEFWPLGANPFTAIPIVLELRKGSKRGRGSYRGWVEVSSEEVLPLNGKVPLSLQKISVTLTPGQSVDVELFPVLDPEDALNHHSVAHALSLLKLRQTSTSIISAHYLGLTGSSADYFHENLHSLLHGDAEARYQVVQQILEQGCVSPLTTSHTVHLVHAVEKPDTPSFLWEGKSGQKPRIYPVVITVKSVADLAKAMPSQAEVAKNGSKASSQSGAAVRPDGTKASWEGYVDKQEKPPPARDRRLWPSEEGGTTTFFVGEVKIDRLTTSRMRCEAKWEEYGAETTRLDHVQKQWIKSPAHRWAQLFSVDDIPTEDEITLSQTDATNGSEQSEHSLDLLRKDKSDTLRALAHSFIDGRARHLTLQLIATSRFTSFFPNDTARAGNTGPGKYESGTPDLRHSTTRVWVPSTFRPAPVEVDRILPTFRWSTQVYDSGHQIAYSREASLRLFLSRQWFSTGEGESLGVVCWPKNLFSSDPLPALAVAAESAAAVAISRMTMSDMDSTTGKFSQFVTRWGADPIHLSGQLDDLISADRFGGYKEKVTKSSAGGQLLLTIPEESSSPTLSNGSSASAPTNSLEVCILSYWPELDQQEGLWFCDVKVDPGPSYFPFLQLGLVRYQAHAVEGLELSRPVTAWAQIPPKREGKVVFINDTVCTIVHRGIGYHQSNTGLKHENERQDSDFPLLNMWLMRAVEPVTPGSNNARINWQPVLDRFHRPIKWTKLRPIQEAADLVWNERISLPLGRKAVHYGLFIEEIEMTPMDQFKSEEGPKSFTDWPFTTELKPRTPFFHVIDLGLSS